jgi:23S rRNA (pseudouridine1915-N3)-methyltransferase
VKLTVVAVGRKMPSWVQEAWNEYARRFPRGLSLELREIPLASRSRNADIAALKAVEGERLLAAVSPNSRVVALDERGKQWSTTELAQRLQNWMLEEQGVAFLVGGPDGLSKDCRERADDIWSLGRLTLPHPMVRAMLAEQLYRAWTITQNHPYHRS